MTNKKVMKRRIGKKLHPTGQLSIFAILIFQVLFILFAMSLNIALVVHDKINLQNSVDLAAYYGAMKQAEMLNAIAHINYQIRQSWKLLTWRYRVLGNIGISNTSQLGNIAAPYDEEHKLKALTNERHGPYFVCLGHKYWGGFYGDYHVSDDDMLCRDMEGTIPAVSVPKVTGALGSFSSMLEGVRQASEDINDALTKQCDFYGYNSWLFGIMAFSLFRYDQTARKFMIHELAKVMAGDGPTGSHPHGTDMDGQSIATGVQKTFEKNLSYVNQKSFEQDRDQLKQFNSLENELPDKWLEDQTFIGIESYTGYYSDFTGSLGSCARNLSFLNKPPDAIDSTAVNDLLKSIGIQQSWPACATDKACNPSAGLKKNINFVVFYTVKAELDYKNQIFLPFNQNIKLRAKAYAKPFGGRIGPDASADPLLPPNSSKPEPISTGFLDFDKRYAPNYSRYPGDPYGLRSKNVHYHWAEHLKIADSTSKSVCNYIKTNDNDPLARGVTDANCGSIIGTDTDSIARKWEMAAVAPDLFDVTYFTILPYYNHTYFPKIRNLLSANLDYVRGDLGTYRDSSGFKGTSILEQVGGYGTIPTIWTGINSLGPSIHRLERPFYKIKNLNLLLTGWNPPKRKYGGNDYEAVSDKINFAKCSKWVHDILDSSRSATKGKIANGCIYGGRTGYSVKMISPNWLRGLEDQVNQEAPW